MNNELQELQPELNGSGPSEVKQISNDPETVTMLTPMDTSQYGKIFKRLDLTKGTGKVLHYEVENDDGTMYCIGHEDHPDVVLFSSSNGDDAYLFGFVLNEVLHPENEVGYMISPGENGSFKDIHDTYYLLTQGDSYDENHPFSVIEKACREGADIELAIFGLLDNMDWDEDDFMYFEDDEDEDEDSDDDK